MIAFRGGTDVALLRKESGAAQGGLHEAVPTDEEQRILQETTHEYTSPYCDVVRTGIVSLAAEGTENTEIAGRLDLL